MYNFYETTTEKKEDVNEIKQTDSIIVEEVELSESSHNKIQQKFMTRLIEPMSKVFQGNFSVIFSMFCVIPVYFHIYNLSIKDEKNIDPDVVNELKERSKLSFDSIPLSSAYCCVDLGNREIAIHISFFKEKDMNLDEFIDKIINYHPKTLGFIYMHEIMHIFNRDLESFESHLRTAQYLFKEIKGEDIGKEHAQRYSNIACDFHINSTLLRKNAIFNDGSFINFILYSRDYNSDNMSVYEIMEDVIKTSKVNIIRFGGMSGNSKNNGNKNENNKDGEGSNSESDGSNDKNGNSKGGKIIISETKAGKIVEVDMGEEKIKGEPDKDHTDPNDTTSGLSDMVRDIVNDMVSKVRGIGSNEILSQLGIPLEVKMNWARLLRRRMSYLCGEKTNKDKTTWTNPNIFSRHVATLPGPEKKYRMPRIYVAIDSSGSMSDEELRKINYILKELNAKGYPITTIIHDFEISKIERFEPKDRGIQEFIKYRYSSGGTSHNDVFQFIEDELKTYADYKKSIVLIASDMYSDIDQIYKKFKWTKYVSTIGLVVDSFTNGNNNYKMPFGETIVIE